MPRIRSVHPGLFTDEVFMELEPQAQIFLIGLWTEADDQGVFPWKPKTLKARLLPASTADAAMLLDELLSHGVLMRFDVEGTTYGAVRNFRKFQRPERPKPVHPITEAVAAFVALPCNSHTCSMKPQPTIGGEAVADHRPNTDAAVAGQRENTDAAVAAHRHDSDPTPTEHRPIDVQSVLEHRQNTDTTPTQQRLPGRMEEEGGRREEESSSSLRSEPRARDLSRSMKGFDEFWSYYPRRVSKGAAEKAWIHAVKAAGGDPGVVVDGLKCRLHLFDTREQGRWIPHPSTWLSEKRWLDAIPGVEDSDPNPNLPLH